ncbi:hypothetical protein BpHYR1_032821 [Brachionus plicatilis]|uniref:Uncharacterized protein n=1 Tax=Brachionus plicatilis TaxID=10195 RepID=A0A3M7SGU5_BRAPC|nr:hypothetical protein BpHYR1_032821 [Brachionus plicatilis]
MTSKIRGNPIFDLIALHSFLDRDKLVKINDLIRLRFKYQSKTTIFSLNLFKLSLKMMFFFLFGFGLVPKKLSTEIKIK